jgi:transforming growth factor-beta-induced protein
MAMNNPAPAAGNDNTAGAVAGPTITDFVSGRNDLSTLELALVRAGLASALDSSGPFTLFAPNNDAFALVPDVFQEILFVNDEFIPHLQDLLLFHVLSGESFGSDLVGLAGTSLTAANGESLAIASPPLTIANVTVVEADNDVANGVVHIISDVLTPSWVFNSIASRVNADSELSTLFQLLVLAGFTTDLNSFGGVFTLLAPTNIAFEALGPDALDILTAEANLDELRGILAYHVISGVFVVAELQDGVRLPSVLAPTTVVVTASPATITLNQAALGGSDILAVNGVVQKIGAVLNFADSPTR